MLIPVILAGGMGTRLWPLSRVSYPKQLLTLIGEQSLLQSVISFVLEIPDIKNMIIVCSQQHHLLIKQQLDLFERSGVSFTFIIEPVAKNTAPAITLAALIAKKIFADNVDLLILPSDHILRNAAAFAEQINALKQFVDKKNLVLFGIKPTYPETGYGYIETEHVLESEKPSPIKSFTEKPNKHLAVSYCQTSNYYWNSGMFYFKSEAYLAEVEKFIPAILDACTKALSASTELPNDIFVDLRSYNESPNISIDYAVMTHTDKGILAALNAPWIDVGSWLTVSTLAAKDDHGNTAIGDVVSHMTQNCYLRAESRLLTTVGLQGQIVIETADAVLVADKSHAQDVKHLVALLAENNRAEIQHDNMSYHSWGQMQTLYNSAEYSLQQVTIYPKQSSFFNEESLYSQHLIIKTGTAQLIFHSGKIAVLHPNQSIDINPGESIKVINSAESPLSMLRIKLNSKIAEQDTFDIPSATICV